MTTTAITALRKAIALVDEALENEASGYGRGDVLESLAARQREFQAGLASLVGNGQPTISEMQVFMKFEWWCKAQTTARAAAAKLGITPSFLCDLRACRRRLPDHIVEAIGYRRRPSDRVVYEEIERESA